MLRPLSHTGLMSTLLVLSAACHGPTSPSSPERDRIRGAASVEVEAVVSAPAVRDGGELAQAFEEFNCTDVLDVHVRFSDPGYVEGYRVGLYAHYEGVPAGDKILRMWWDRDNDVASFQDIRLGQGEASKGDDQLFDLEVLAEHVYAPPLKAQYLTVRAELIIVGKTGNCSRNRTLTITPSTSSVASEPPADGCHTVRFCDLGNGTVRDEVTGLVWLREAGCFPFRRFAGAVDATASLADGQCGLADGSAPRDWRLPTVAELSSLLDPRFSDPSLSNAAGDGPWAEGDAFFGVRNQAHWTSDLQDRCLGPLPGAMVVNVGNGDARCRLVSIGIARFWPVRIP